MNARGYSTPLVPLPRRRAQITTLERLQTPHKFGQLEAPALTGILGQLDKGKPEEWADLVEFALSSDDHLRSLYDTRITRVVQAEYQIVPNEFGDPRQAQLAADMVNRHLGRIKKWREFMKGALHAEALGYSCSEIHWDRDGATGEILPAMVEPVHPHRFRFDEQWRPRIYDRGQRRGVISKDTFNQYGEVLNPSGWVVHLGSGLGGYPNSRGYMRSCIWHWMFKRWVEGFYISFIEKYGSGRAHGQVPKGATDEVRRKALEALELWTNDGFAVLEEGSTIVIDAMDAATSSETAHAQYISYIERVHTKAVLGTSDAADPGQNGSQAAVGARTGATMDPRMVADGMSLCDSLHDQLFYWDCYYNRHLFDGGNVPPVPRMQFKTASDEQKTDVQGLVDQHASEQQAAGQRPPMIQVPGALEQALQAPQQNTAQQQHPGEARDPMAAAVPMADPMLPNQPVMPMQQATAPAKELKPADVKFAMDVSRACKANEIEYSAGCRMLTHFFGCDEATARELIGTPPQPVVPVAPSPEIPATAVAQQSAQPEPVATSAVDQPPQPQAAPEPQPDPKAEARSSQRAMTKTRSTSQGQMTLPITGLSPQPIDEYLRPASDDQVG